MEKYPGFEWEWATLGRVESQAQRLWQPKKNQSTFIKQQPNVLKSVEQSGCQRVAVISRKSKHATDISCAQLILGEQ